MQKIIPHLWFDTQAKEAAEFYASVFPNSKVTNITTLKDTPSGDCDVVSFTIAGHDFMAISAGPLFKPNPSISFMVNFDPSKMDNAEEQLNTLWEKLSDGGKALMPLDTYAWSKRYGWVEDKYGISWQLILTNPDGEDRPFIVPTLLFVGDQHGNAEAAMNMYLSVFTEDSEKGNLVHYGAGQEPNKEGTVMFEDFRILGTWFAAMDGGATEHNFAFNEAISFMVKCDTQEEINYYWEKLSAVPESEQCGWLKDMFGVSWQISPTILDDVMANGDEETIQRVTQAFLQMKKFDIAELERAAKGE